MPVRGHDGRVERNRKTRMDLENENTEIYT